MAKARAAAMGNSDSKLSNYRDHVFKLADHDTIPLYSNSATVESIAKYYKLKKEGGGIDPFSEFYNYLAHEPTTAAEIYGLITSQELRTIYESNETNFSNLVRFTSFKICSLTNDLQSKQTSISNFNRLKNELLNCVRILTKIIPIFFERDSDCSHELTIFWNRNSKEVFNYTENASADPTAIVATKGTALSPVSSLTDEVDDLVSVRVSTDYQNKISPDSLRVAIKNGVNTEDLVPLGVLLLQSCLKLLFMEGFTLPLSSHDLSALGCVSNFLWENGINTSEASYKPAIPSLDCNRLEILRLVLTLCSKQLYSQGLNRFLSVMCTSMPEYGTICLLSSLLNLVCRSCRDHDENNGLNYPANSYSNSVKYSNMVALRKSLVISSIQLLNLMLCFQIPSSIKHELYEFLYSLNLYHTEVEITNMATSYFSTLNKEFDMKLILISLAKLFKRPMDLAIENESNPFNLLNNNSGGNKRASVASTSSGSSNYAPTNNDLPNIPTLSLQVIVLLWELMKCNKSVENYVADKYANKLLIICIYYLKYYSDFPQWNNTLIPVVSGVATYLSSRKLVLSKMLDPFNVNYYTNKLPNFYKLSSGNINNITYRDFAIIQLSNIAIAQVNKNLPLKSYVFELIYNMLPVPQDLKDEELVQLSSVKRGRSQGLSYNAATTLIHLISKIANVTFLSTPSEHMPSTRSSTASANTVASLANTLPPVTTVQNKLYMYSPGLKLDLLALLLRAVVVYVLFYYQDSKNLLFALCRHAKIIYHLNDVIDDISESLSQAAGESSDDTSSDENTASGIATFDTSAIVKNPAMINYFQETERGNLLNNGTSMMGGDSGEFLVSQPLFYENEVDDHDQDEKISQVGSTSAGKSIALHEHLDYTFDPVSVSMELFTSLRPERPLGMTLKYKAKRKYNQPLNKSWLGSSSLYLLMKIIQIVSNQFPQIIKISAADYFKLLSEVGNFEKEFQDLIAPIIPLEISAMSNNFQTLSVEWNRSSNQLATTWYHSVLWSDIFDKNSSPFTNPTGVNNNEKQDNNQQPPTTPSLERWNSHGSAISRTNSNNSSIVNYFGSGGTPNHQESESLSNSTPSSPNVGGGLASWFGGKSANGGNNANERQSSLFRLSWAGFSKTEHDGTIDEEGYDQNTKTPVPSKRSLFILDLDILKPNIWVGTHVKLFKTTIDEKEEFSFIDMTSSLLRKFRFNSSVGSNSTEGNGNVNGASTNLTSVNSRPWTPKNSHNSNGPVPTIRNSNNTWE